MKILEPSSTPQIFIIFFYLALYAIIWTCAGYFLNLTVPYDAVEALNWANNLEFGSPKNPYMVGFVMFPSLLLKKWVALDLYWYASHFLAVSLGMLGVWLLGLRLFGRPILAFFSLMSLNLTGIINFDILPYNDNYLLVMFWPYLFLFFIKALYDHQKYWFLLALCSGLAAMSKYSSFAFLPFMLISLLFTSTGRKAFKYKEFYFSILLFILIITPNFIWLYQHDFAAFNWVKSQIKPALNLTVIIAFLCVFYPIIIILLILLPLGAKIAYPNTAEKKHFVFIFLSPVFCIFIYFLFNEGGRITEWIQPFAILASSLTLCFLNVDKIKKWRNMNLCLLFFSILVCSGYILVLHNNIKGAGKKLDFIKKVSAQLNELWKNEYHTPLKYVGGGYLSQWLTFYSPDHPFITTKWSNENKPNIYNAHISLDDLQNSGALFLSHSGENCETADFNDVKKDYPGIHLTKKRDYGFTTEKGENIQICLAFLAPKKSR